jgi:O-antigen/teichoic acid export membrane protein
VETTARLQPPTPLSGPSAATLVIHGLYYELGAFAVGCLVAVEAYLPGPWYAWAAVIVAVVVGLLSIGLTRTLRGYRKIPREKERGYTTVIGDAIKDPSLFFLHRRTLRVVAVPHQPRPRRLRRE